MSFLGRLTLQHHILRCSHRGIVDQRSCVVGLCAQIRSFKDINVNVLSRDKAVSNTLVHS